MCCCGRVILAVRASVASWLSSTSPATSCEPRRWIWLTVRRSWSTASSSAPTQVLHNAGTNLPVVDLHDVHQLQAVIVHCLHLRDETSQLPVGSVHSTPTHPHTHTHTHTTATVWRQLYSSVSVNSHFIVWCMYIWCNADLRTGS